MSVEQMGSTLDMRCIHGQNAFLCLTELWKITQKQESNICIFNQAKPAKILSTCAS